MLQKEFCKTLYELCRFMGKTVTLNKGKDILVLAPNKLFLDYISDILRYR